MTTMQWVKCSEKLPPNPGSPQYHFRIDGFHKVNGNFHYSIDDEKCEGEIVFTVQGWGCFDNYQISKEKFSSIEWLSESPPSIEGEEKEDYREAIRKAWRRLNYGDRKAAFKALCDIMDKYSFSPHKEQDESPSSTPLITEAEEKKEDWQHLLEMCIYTVLISHTCADGYSIPCKEREDMKHRAVERFKKELYARGFAIVKKPPTSPKFPKSWDNVF